MSPTDVEVLKEALQRHWPGQPDNKARGYIGQFFNGTRLGTKISAQVEGNHGTYTVTIRVDEKGCFCQLKQAALINGKERHRKGLPLYFYN